MTTFPPDTAARVLPPATRTTLLLLVVMTGIAPIALYIFVPALPIIVAVFDSEIGIAQMTVSR